MRLQCVGAKGASGGLYGVTKLCLSSFGFHYVNRKVSIGVTGAPGSGTVRESTESQTRCQSNHMNTPHDRRTKQSPINTCCKGSAQFTAVFLPFTYTHLLKITHAMSTVGLAASVSHRMQKSPYRLPRSIRASRCTTRIPPLLVKLGGPNIF